jgi:hypothetical protein
MIRDLSVLARVSNLLDRIEDSASATIETVGEIRGTIAATEASLQLTQERLKGLLSGAVTPLDQWRELFLES